MKGVGSSSQTTGQCGLSKEIDVWKRKWNEGNEGKENKKEIAWLERNDNDNQK